MCTAQPRCRHSYKSFLGCKWFLFFELRDWVVYEERMDIFIHIPFNLLYTLFLCIVKPIGNYPSYGIIQFCLTVRVKSTNSEWIIFWGM